MKRYEPQSIRDILDSVVDQYDLREDLDRHRAIKLWPNIVGTTLANATGKPWCRGSVMYIAVHNAALRHELTMQRSGLTNAINKHFEKTIITEIRFIGE